MTAKPITTCVLLLMLYCHAVAQRIDLTGGTIGAFYTVLPSQSFKDTAGGFGYHAWAVNLNIPLFGNRYKVIKNVLNGDKPSFYQVSAHAAFESLRAAIGFVNNDRTIYQYSAGLGGLFYNGKKNLILADLSVGIASDKLVIEDNNTKYRFSGLLLVNHIQSSSLIWQYGLVFNYAFGRPLPLPVLGVRKKFARTWSFSAILPVSVQFTDRISKTMHLSFSLRPAGNRFQLQNQQNFATASLSVYMQLRQFELGIGWQYRFAKQFSLGADAGLLAGGKLKFTEVDNFKTILSQATMKPGFKGRITLRYHLPHKKESRDNAELDPDLLRLN